MQKNNPVEILVACLVVLVVNGCFGKSIPKVDPKGEQPATEVETAPAIAQKLVDYREFTGRTAAVQSIEVRVQVSGYLKQSPQSQLNENESPSGGESPNSSVVASEDLSPKKAAGDQPFLVLAREGDRVQVGTPLFEIDPTPYTFALAQAEGTLAATTAQLKRLALDLKRAKDLIGSVSISQADYDLAVANEAEALGQYENVKASVSRAKLNLSFTRITAPIEGFLGRTLVTNGNLVSADSTILTTIVSTDPVQAYFDVDENSVLDYRSRVRSGSVQSAREISIPVQLALANEDNFPHPGFIDFVNNTTDPNTGSTRLRGRFANASGALSPGLFARIRVPFSEEYTAILVPTKALGMDQQGRFAFVVDEKNVVHRRSIKTGTIKGAMTVISNGISAGEQVVVSGLQKVREGSTVVQKVVEEPGRTNG